jgi:SAM-dependent methyltransferase
MRVRVTVRESASQPRIMERRAVNVHSRTVEDFGREWTTFDQDGLPDEELRAAFQRYFSIFPWEQLRADAEGFDFGCGSGRWARFVAPQVGLLHCVDASTAALAVARRNLSSHTNCSFHHSVAETLPLAPGTMDFGYSLGVLHHVPDTASALAECVRRLKPGAPFLIYLYYRFDNRPPWFRVVWRASDLVRRAISRFPHPVKVAITSVIAAIVYWPAARASRLLERRGADVSSLPLSFYRNHSLYTMRTDALDRFGTRLEQRFTAEQIRRMMTAAGLEHIEFSQSEPFWCALGYRAGDSSGP